MGLDFANYAIQAFCFYALIEGLIFLFNPEWPLRSFFELKHKDLNNDELKSGMIWCQVIGMSHITWLLLQCPGPRGFFMAAAAHTVMFAKLYYFDGCTIPMPLVFLVIVTFSGSCYSFLTAKGYQHCGKLSFYLFSAAMSVVSLLCADTLIKNVTPAVENNEKGLDICKNLIQVIGVMNTGSILIGCPRPMGNMMAMVSLAGLFGWLRKNEVGPPMYCLIIFIGIVLLQITAVVIERQQCTNITKNNSSKKLSGKRKKN